MADTEPRSVAKMHEARDGYYPRGPHASSAQTSRSSELLRRIASRSRRRSRTGVSRSSRCRGRARVGRSSRSRAGVSRSGGGRRRSGGGLGGFLLRAGRQHQRRHECAKSKFGFHRSVPRREARVVKIPKNGLIVPRVPSPDRGAKFYRVPARFETAALQKSCGSGATGTGLACLEGRISLQSPGPTATRLRP